MSTNEEVLNQEQIDSDIQALLALPPFRDPKRMAHVFVQAGVTKGEIAYLYDCEDYLKLQIRKGHIHIYQLENDLEDAIDSDEKEVIKSDIAFTKDDIRRMEATLATYPARRKALYLQLQKDELAIRELPWETNVPVLPRCSVCEARGCSLEAHSDDEIELKAFCRQSIPQWEEDTVDELTQYTGGIAHDDYSEDSRP